MSNFLLGFSVGIFIILLISKFSKKQTLLKKRKVLIFLGIIAFLLSIILSFEDIIFGFKDGWHESENIYQNLST